MMLAFDIDAHSFPVIAGGDLFPVIVDGNAFRIVLASDLEFKGIISYTAHTAFKGRDGIIDLNQYADLSCAYLMHSLFRKDIPFTVY